MKLWPFSQKTEPEPEANEVEKPEAKNSLDINDDRFYEKIAGIVASNSATGISVTEASAMKFSAVYACVSLLAGTLASLRCEVYTRVNGFPEVVDTRLNTIIQSEPSPLMTAYVFWQAIGYNLFLAGNGYAIIARTKVGDPRSLVWVPAQCVTPKFNQNRTRILYTVSYEGISKTYDQDDILHFPCIGWDGLKGMSPIAAATEGIGLGLAGEKYNAHFFSNGITSDIAINYPQGLTVEAESELQDYLGERYSGVDNLRKPLITKGAADVKNLGMSANDAQMIEARDYQVEDICRFYGVPPWIVGAMKKNTSFGSGLSEQTLGFVKFTIRKQLKMAEQEIDRKLIRNSKRFCKFNLDGLLRADIKTRNEAYKVALGGNQSPGYMSVNEVRKIEGLPPDKNPKSDEIYRPVENQGSTATSSPTGEVENE